MIAVHFSKAFAEKVNDAVNQGKPIPLPEGGQWTQNDMLTLAGLLYAAVYSGGPHKQQIEGVTASDVKKMHSERREAIEDTWFQDIHDGIEFVSMLAFKVFDGEYDDDCEPELKAIIATNAKGQKKVQLVEGFKKSEGAGDSD
jgi:hypothetical protein